MIYTGGLMESPKFEPMPKIGRLSRNCIITEKIDGTNASIYIGSIETGDDGLFLTGSRTRWITPANDNQGFARWADVNKEELLKLGPGHHFGEWWGAGIQRRYGLTEKRFSLFNATRWGTERPACCHVVPILYEGMFDTNIIQEALKTLKFYGSWAAPGFADPEGIVIYHTAAKTLFKKTLEKDEQPKGISEA
jgi:hypothetical protein